jgi:hypothetical protein
MGNGTFVEMGMALGVGDTNAGRGMAMADYDQDGDLDAFVSVVNSDSFGIDPSRLYRNDQQSGNHWLQVELRGTYSNRDAYGSQMIIKVNGQRWVHEVDGGSSHCSQSTSIAHFGMGQDSTVDSLYVIWPSGNLQLLTEIAADQRILVVEDSASFLAFRPGSNFRLQIFPNPFEDRIELRGKADFGEMQLKCWDVQGREMLQKAFSAQGNGAFSFQLDDMGDWPAGIYLLELSNATDRIRRKIIKQ